MLRASHAAPCALTLTLAALAVELGACAGKEEASSTTATTPSDAAANAADGASSTTAASSDAGNPKDGAVDAAPPDASDGAAPPSCFGCGFWDDFSVGTWRTDFDDPDAGGPGHPLTLQSCPYTLGSDPEVLNGAGPTYWDENKSVQVACDKTSTTYAASNASTSAASWPLDRFWVISANNERAYGAEGACSDTGPNTGPPNQSKKVFAPGQGVFGVGVAGGKATLAIDTNAFPNCVSPVDKGKIPFLSLGAQTGRGQRDPITFLNDPSVPAKLVFKATLEDIAPAGVASSLGTARANFAYVFIEASWGGMRRWAYIDLMARTVAPPQLTRGHWNWNMQQSMWFPGAELIYLTASDLAATCKDPNIVATTLAPTAGASFDYSLDLNAVFSCLSNLPQKAWTTPLPKNKLAITGVHWAIEQTYGKNWTKLSIQSPHLAK